MTITLADIQTIRHREWSARAWIGGQAVTLVGGLPTRTITALRGRSTAQLELRDLPPEGDGLDVVIDLILDGYKVSRFFTGKTAPASFGSANVQRQVNVIDRVNLARALPAAITWDNTPFVDAVTELLAAAGVDETEIDSIFDPGVSFAVGAVDPVIITPRESIGSVMAELMAYGGTALIVTPTGRIRVIDSPGIPAADSALIYADGADVDAGELPIFDAGLQVEGNEDQVSIFTATGPTLSSGAVPDGTFTATGIVGKPDGKQYRFAQTDAVALIIAERELGRRARNRRTVWAEVPLNPGLLPGDTVLLRAPGVGLVENTPAIVMEAPTTDDARMRLVLSIGASATEGYGSSTPPPIVDFSIVVEAQQIVVAGAPANRSFVQVRDQSRDPLGFPLASRSWTATGTGATPTSSTDPEPLFSFSSLAGATISLQVTAQSGESATLTRAVETPLTTTTNRVVSVAAGANGWRVLTSAGWDDFAEPGGADCTAVPPECSGILLYAGFDNGALYAVAGSLRGTTPSLAHTFADPVVALFANAGEADELLAITSGLVPTLWRSGDNGVTWSAIRFGTSLLDVASWPGIPTYIALANANRLEVASPANGTFYTAASVTTGALARSVAMAPWGHIAGTFVPNVSLGGTVLFGDSVKIVAAQPSGLTAPCTVDWSGVLLAERPADGLVSVTALVNEEAFVVGEASRLARDPVLGGLVFGADPAGAGALWKISRTGATTYAASLINATTPAGPSKLVNLGATYPIDTVTTARQIGTGELAVAASFSAPASSFGSLLITSVGLNLGVGGSPPAGWEATAYDDSAWTATVAGQPLIAFTGALSIRAAGAQASGTVHLTRQDITIPAGTIQRARIRAKADNKATFYIGGQLVGVAEPPINTTPEIVLAVSPSILSAGATVIAVQIENYVASGGNPMGVAYILEINY